MLDKTLQRLYAANILREKRACMYTYTITESKQAVAWGNGNTSCRIEITDTTTGETRACDAFTYLDDDGQEMLEYLYNTNFEG